MPNLSSKGFSLVELLIVLAVICVLIIVLLTTLKPFEKIKESRDAIRMADLANIQNIINIVLQENSAKNHMLCDDNFGFCLGFSDEISPNVAKNDGTGWVKINLQSIKSITSSVLPLDPINKDGFKYSYASDGTRYELDATLESDKYKDKMRFDGGDNLNKFEIGTNTFLIQ